MYFFQSQVSLYEFCPNIEVGLTIYFKKVLRENKIRALGFIKWMLITNRWTKNNPSLGMNDTMYHLKTSSFTTYFLC